MNARSQLLCAWCAPLFALVYLIGLWPLAQFLPPHLPSASAQEIAALYQARTLPIRAGLFLMMGSSGLLCAFVALITTVMKRIPNSSPILPYVQLSAGSCGVVLLIVPCLMWTAAAFRPERSPELILLLNDLGWIMLFMPFGTFVVQNFAIGLAILGDTQDTPVLPRWLGFFNLWVGVLFIPGGMLTFFKTGPFAWSGVFVYWIPLVVFLAWFLTMFAVLRQVVLQQARTEAIAQPA